ncbi:MAG: RnfABCDGE type electron transport complex subunit D, partial [Sedimentisphaerales bacterium]|nr:RnfABCDGE type electron transport complex subunit D [Sedimentisphaerales bacterium]
FYFRIHALILIVSCSLAAVATEWLCNLVRKKPNSLGDLSAVVTGIILALSLPPTLPLWAAIIGSVFAIAIGKMVFGGLGGNIFNPAMVGRAFLTASFGVMMTTWTVPATIDESMPRIAADNKVQALTQATPLAYSKQAIKSGQVAEIANKQLWAAFTGQTGGCLGETSALALLIGGAYLLLRRTISLHIPAAVLSSAFVFAGAAYLINPDAYISPLLHLCSGGLLIGAFFIATDPVTAPLTKKGMWIFGAGVGTVTMLIRIVGEYPEGVMFSILLMNAVTPLIDRLCRLTPAGGKPSG